VRDIGDDRNDRAPILIQSSEIAARELAFFIARVLPPNLIDLQDTFYVPSPFTSERIQTRLARNTRASIGEVKDRSRDRTIAHATRASVDKPATRVHTVGKRRKKGNHSESECKKPSGRRRIRLCHLPFGLGECRTSRSLARLREKNAKRAAFSHKRDAECFVDRVVNFNATSDGKAPAFG